MLKLIQQPRSRVPVFGLNSGALNSEQARQGSKPLMNGLGSSANTWGGSIWGTGSAIGSGLKNGLQDRTPTQSKIRHLSPYHNQAL